MTTPKVYVSTHASYNSGSIEGKWVELTDKDSFKEALQEIAPEEHDPEFMFQDCEGFPKGFLDGDSLNDSLWDWIDCDSEEREMWESYADALGYSIQSVTLRDAQENYAGKYESGKDFAKSFFEETYDLEVIPKTLLYCIDWDMVYREMRYDVIQSGGHYFWSY